MAGTVREFYDELSSDYHLIFEDWEDATAKRAVASLTRASGTRGELE
jgi:hypothetical protein